VCDLKNNQRLQSDHQQREALISGVMVAAPPLEKTSGTTSAAGGNGAAAQYIIESALRRGDTCAPPDYLCKEDDWTAFARASAQFAL
jgi:hypothetical protein